jgi:hypothetical protein
LVQSHRGNTEGLGHPAHGDTADTMLLQEAGRHVEDLAVEHLLYSV